jgi:outer membrane protein assembly factor BamA
MKKSIIFLFLLFAIRQLQGNILFDPIHNISKYDSANFKIGLLPFAFYSPETRFGFGGFVYSYFSTSDKDLITRKSNTRSYLSYTINNQFSFENDYQIWLNRNKYYLTGELDFSRFPEYFYGIGNETKNSDRMMISFDIIKIHLKTLKLIRANLYGGIDITFQKLHNQDVNLKTPIMCDLVPGGMGYIANGIGPIFIFDKRNNPFNPSNGSYIETSLLHFDRLIGSAYKFTSFILDARKYNTILKKIIWNGNAYFFFNKGEVPFRMMATIGGARFLRGYYRGRFRDNNMVLVQQEFRMPIYKWFGFAAFAGMGSVAKEIRDFSENTIHYNYGVGLRIRVNEKENANLRLDYGITKDSHGIYLVFAEAF